MGWQAGELDTETPEPSGDPPVHRLPRILHSLPPEGSWRKGPRRWDSSGCGWRPRPPIRSSSSRSASCSRGRGPLPPQSLFRFPRGTPARRRQHPTPPHACRRLETTGEKPWGVRTSQALNHLWGVFTQSSEPQGLLGDSCGSDCLQQRCLGPQPHPRPPPLCSKALVPLNSPLLCERERELGDPSLSQVLVWPCGVAPTCRPKGGSAEVPGWSLNAGRMEI